MRVSAAGGVCVCLCVAVALLRACAATGIGRCPVYPQLPDFDIQRMTGKWYEVERSFYLMEITASCTELDVALNDKGQLLIDTKTVNRWTGMSSRSSGIGILSHNGSSVFRYKLNNRMPYVLGRLLPGAGLYNVLFTDYAQFALVWSCTNFSFAHSDRMWVIGREREIPAPLRARIYAIMQDLRLDPDRLIASKNYNCTIPDTAL